MTAIDSTGLQALENLADRVHESGRQLILCGAREQPAMRMHEAEFHEHVGTGEYLPKCGRSPGQGQEHVPRSLEGTSVGGHLGQTKYRCFAVNASIDGGDIIDT